MRNLSRRRSLGLAFGLMLSPVAALAQSAQGQSTQGLSLDDISAYINDITEAQASFTQVNDDGSISRGTVSIKRPGRIRFDYDPPNGALVMASGGALYVEDRKLGGRPETYPLSQTPLGLILGPTVDLRGSGAVQSISTKDGITTVATRDPNNPDNGMMVLSFSENPTMLRQWVVLDTG